MSDTKAAAMFALALALALVPSVARAEAPPLLNVQGVVRDADGAPANGAFAIRFALYGSRDGGPVYWSGVMPGVAVAGGVFAATLGEDPQNPLPPATFSSASELWLGIQVGDEPSLPRQRLVSVPYSMEASHASDADVAAGLDCDGCVDPLHLSFPAATGDDLAALQAAFDALQAEVDAMGPSIGQIVCPEGRILQYDGSRWFCSADFVTRAEYAAHNANAAAHHARYTDAEARAAAGATLGQLGCQDGEIAYYDRNRWVCTRNFVAPAALTAHAADTNAHHARYTDAEARAAVGTRLDALNCAAGQVPERAANGAWACAGDYVKRPPDCDAAGEALQWDGNAWRCVVMAGGAPTPPVCNQAGQSLQWNGTAWACANTAGATPPRCDGAGEALQWDGAAYRCRALGQSVLPAAACDDPGEALQWDGSAWVCSRPADPSLPQGVCAGEDQVLQWNGAMFTCATPAKLPEPPQCSGDGDVLRWDGDDFLCAQPETLPAPPACDAPGEALQWDGASFACTDAAGAAQPLAACDGPGEALQWNGLDWQCVRPADESLPADVCADPGQALQWDGAAFQCVQTVDVLPDDTCEGQWQSLQWDGVELTCVDLRATGGSAGRANGFELVDDWGYVWDGTQRAPRAWDVARADCEARGGRLPTATELFRNNASTGTGNLSDPNAGSYLWTQILSYHSDIRHVAIRLSDGAVTYNTDVSPTPYRCVWPDRTSDAFNGDYCYGPAGSECFSYRFWQNVDRLDRPPLNFTAAQNECNFYNASVVTFNQFENLVHMGWTNGSNNWLWTADAREWSNAGAYGVALARWSGTGQPNWDWGRGDGTYTSASDNQRYRCIGKRSASLGTLPENPACNGGCFSVTRRGARIIADRQDRSTADYRAASEVCRLAGASIPGFSEFSDLVHAGWPAGSNNWYWSSEPTYWGAYGYMGLRWSGDGNARWLADGTSMTVLGPTSAYTYRCVWHETFEPALTTCAAGERQIWDGAGFACAASVNGDSQGRANPGGLQLVDPWGNAWDLLQRGQRAYVDARDFCTASGGRLPTPTEVFRMRANQAQNDSIGDVNATSYLWTIVPEYRGGRRVTIRVSDGSTSSEAEGNQAPFRCVWPSTKGDAFGSRSCYGAAGDPCFRTDHLRWDRFDRAALPLAAAVEECQFYGGRLPDHEEFLQLVHAGAPNGSNNWLWIEKPMYWHSGNFGYPIGRWPNGGTPDWMYWSGPYGSLSEESDYRPFRCVFTDRIK